MQSVIPIVSNDKISNIRKRIIKLLEESRDLDILGNFPTIRYYKMTVMEFELAKSQYYLFTIFFGKFPDSESKVEAMCFDIRTLLKEKYIVLNDQICYVPITLSAKRWNQLLLKNKDIGDYTFETGKLTFPLYLAELTYIFKNIRSSPIICSSSQGCVPVSLEQFQNVVGLITLPDESIENRFGIVKEPIIISSELLSSQLDIDEKTNSIINMTEKELKDIQIENQNVYSRLKSEETKMYIKDLLVKGKSEAHIISSLLSDSFDIVLSK